MNRVDSKRDIKWWEGWK